MIIKGVIFFDTYADTFLHSIFYSYQMVHKIEELLLPDTNT